MPPPFNGSPVVATNILTNISTVETMISAHPVNCLTLVRNGVIKTSFIKLARKNERYANKNHISNKNI